MLSAILKIHALVKRIDARRVRFCFSRRAGGKLPIMATPRTTRDPLFLGRWFQDEIIIVAVRWYLTYPLSIDRFAMLRDRGISVPLSTIMRWVTPLRTGVRETLVTG